MKTGKESFILNGNNLPINVLLFWQWSTSELLDTPRGGWDDYDLITKVGLKKETALIRY